LHTGRPSDLLLLRRGQHKRMSQGSPDYLRSVRARACLCVRTCAAFVHACVYVHVQMFALVWVSKQKGTFRRKCGDVPLRCFPASRASLACVRQLLSQKRVKTADCVRVDNRTLWSRPCKAKPRPGNHPWLLSRQPMWLGRQTRRSTACFTKMMLARRMPKALC